MMLVVLILDIDLADWSNETRKGCSCSYPDFWFQIHSLSFTIFEWRKRCILLPPRAWFISSIYFPVLIFGYFFSLTFFFFFFLLVQWPYFISIKYYRIWRSQLWATPDMRSLWNWMKASSRKLLPSITWKL